MNHDFSRIQLVMCLVQRRILDSQETTDSLSASAREFATDKVHGHSPFSKTPVKLGSEVIETVLS